MNLSKGVRLQNDCQGIDWKQLIDLFQSTGLAGREGNKVRRASEKSTFVCFALAGSRHIGASRALTDHEYHATIYDFAAHPAYQRQGLWGAFDE